MEEKISLSFPLSAEGSMSRKNVRRIPASPLCLDNQRKEARDNCQIDVAPDSPESSRGSFGAVRVISSRMRLRSRRRGMRGNSPGVSPSPCCRSFFASSDRQGPKNRPKERQMVEETLMRDKDQAANGGRNFWLYERFVYASTIALVSVNCLH